MTQRVAFLRRRPLRAAVVRTVWMTRRVVQRDRIVRHRWRQPEVCPHAPRGRMIGARRIAREAEAADGVAAGVKRKPAAERNRAADTLPDHGIVARPELVVSALVGPVPIDG